MTLKATQKDSNPTNAKHTIKPTFSYGVIYVYSIPGEQHKGRLKIGSATVSSSDPTQAEIDEVAHRRIKQQTKTADIHYLLEYATLAVTSDGQYLSDHDVHNVLVRSGFERKPENSKNPHSEWFEIDLKTSKNAITAAKEGRISLRTDERISDSSRQFSFRPNQLDAIAQTNRAIKQRRKHYLWNAKMRFGKTSAAMQVAKENNMKRVLIITHRPSVSDDWYSDFKKVFAGTDYQYSSKTKGESLVTHLQHEEPFIYFASLQDLRLSEMVVSDELSNSLAKGFKKNENIFGTNWDMLIVDEAHEGTQSNLGDVTISKIPTNFTLQLSGTPFNILHKLEENEIYTWDYVMEQRDKQNWDVEHPGVPNPYAELPALSILTYEIDTFKDHIGSLGEGFHDALDGGFRFHEFFRVLKDENGNDTAQFAHEQMVKKFLDLLVNDQLATQFPYATEEYRGYIKHSLWLLPNRTKVIEAMEKLLRTHPVFGKFGIVNISGNAHEDDDADSDAKERVTKAIANNEYTITLTGQRLTTGASIPQWTAIFMMSDTASATTYLQTAFRCQTPARIDGKLKTQGYVFDFAPDRTLKLVAEAVELNHKSGKTNSPEQKQAMAEFLNFCPILAAEGGSMKPYDVGKMLEQLKKAIIERVSRNGFDDPKLYNDELLMLDELEIKRFSELKAIVGAATGESISEIKVNNLGMTDLKAQKAEEAERKKKQNQGLTDEQKAALKALNEAREQKRSAISILRAVSIRMPMLVYGANVSLREDITLTKFIELVDDESWVEFMPAGLTKEKFREFTKYYDEEVFRGVTRSIRAKVFDCEELLPTERVQAIASIFSTFKNPDKETVLTPWDVVNLQITATLGGSDFRTIIGKSKRPEWLSRGDATKIWSDDNTTILEINSKSGLYPLLAAYNIYSRQLIKYKQSEDKIHKRLWNEVLTRNIYVLCKSPMAVTITRRTLSGYSGVKVNIVYIKDLIKKLRQEGEYKGYNIDRELQEKFRIDRSEVKFTAVVGNPPYQMLAKGGSSSDDPIYHLFMEEAYKLTDKASLITPARFLFNAGKTPKAWNSKMLNDKHLKVVYYVQKSSKIFPNTDIKGGVAITYRDTTKDFGAIKSFVHFEELKGILSKVESKSIEYLDSIVSGRNIYRLTRDAIREHPELENLQSKGHKDDIGSSAFKILKDIVFFETKPNDGQEYTRVIGLLNNQRVYLWIQRRYLSNPNNFEKYKVMLPKANGTGAIGEALSTPLIGSPLVGFTDTFISIGAFGTLLEGEAALKYIKSKFARAMLGILKITQVNAKFTWAKVPLQKFTSESDIDWTQSIEDIDKQLYVKYDLNEKEIGFIETHVKAME